MNYPFLPEEFSAELGLMFFWKYPLDNFTSHFGVLLLFMQEDLLLSLETKPLEGFSGMSEVNGPHIDNSLDFYGIVMIKVSWSFR